MKHKIYYLKSIPALILLIFCQSGHGQCNQQNIRASGYLHGVCNGLQFQGVIGSMSSSYGECGGLSFDTPLSGTDIPTSATDVDTYSRFEIFPNPTTGSIQIVTSSNRSYRIDLYATIGQLIMSKKVENEAIFQLSLENLKAGCYFLKVTEANTKTKIHKIIKI